MKKMIALMAVFMTFTATSVQAAPGVIKLGVTKLTDRTDRDVLLLPRCRFSANKPVSHVKLTVGQFPAQIDHLKVTFHNGQSQKLPVRLHYRVGESTRWIDLRGPKRCIKKLVIIGDTDTVFNRPLAQAKVTVFGLK